ncbi:ribosomal protein S18-alanine N-acetyltransferase [candidate division KSB1 bacterium]|nr:ribosomal protein S18-alanine N-acetyltransferase [candidate division KSB1 bacterium]
MGFASKNVVLEFGEVMIRPMRHEDLAQIIRIEEMNFPMPWSVKAFEYELEQNKNSVAFVAESNSRVIAYSVAHIIIDEMHLLNLSVDRNFRRRRIGELILTINIDHARQYDCSIITLEVRKSNLAAIMLYQKHGFRQTGLRRGYYEPYGEDALLLSLGLANAAC